MLSKRAGVTVLVLFLTAAAIAAYMATSLLMPASAHPSPPPTVPEKPTGISASPGENGVTLQWDDPGDKSVTKYPIVRTMLQDGRPVLTSITVAENTAAGVEIGDPIAARDPDGSSLTYTLEGNGHRRLRGHQRYQQQGAAEDQGCPQPRGEGGVRPDHQGQRRQEVGDPRPGGIRHRHPQRRG